MTADNKNSLSVVPITQGEKSIQKTVAEFVYDHPLATITGGLALGVVAAAVIPKRNRKIIAKRSSLWGKALSAAGAAMAQQAMTQIKTAIDHAKVVSDKTERTGQEP